MLGCGYNITANFGEATSNGGELEISYLPTNDITLGLGAGYVSSWTGDPGAVTKYTVRLSAPAIVPADGRGDIEYTGRIKSLDPDTRSGVVIIGAKSVDKKIFGMATMNVRFS